MPKKIKKCNCWSCEFLPKIRKFEQSLDAEKLVEFRALFGEVWDRMEASEMELNILASKIDGSWPRESNEPYYYKVGQHLYKVKGVKIPNLVSI